MDNPLISIIVPSYNQGNYIRKTIDSILTQSYKNVEIIVMDGGSGDQTIGILQSYGNEIQWISENDRGQTHAINKGILKAKGEIISYLNSDDYFLDGALQKVVEAFEENPNLYWLTADYIIVDANEKPIQSAVIWYKRFFRKFLSFPLLSVLNPVIQPSTFLRKEIISELGFFREDLHYTMDYDYWMRAIQNHQPILLDTALSAFRIHVQSKGGSRYREQFKEEIYVAEQYCKSKLLLSLHRIHNWIIIMFYSFMKSH
jgi:glycosyltransferase involved in cell wall biosynthesis